MKNVKKILWGVVLVAIGVVLALRALNIIPVDLFFDGWWTLFIIVPSFIGLITEREKTGSLIALAVGVILLLACQDLIGFDMIWKLLVPVIIILIGIKLIFGGFFAKTSKEVKKKLEEKSHELKAYTSVFSGQDVRLDGERFTGAELNAVFGGIKLDLSGALLDAESVINASAIFGGIDIILPENVNVKVDSTSIFGGVSNKKEKTSVEGAPTVYIRGTCMFGGVDIK